MAIRAWHPITDYEVDPLQLADKELAALSSVWVEQRAKLGESLSISEFTERLKREWAIETGLIERLYTLDRGVTELMIERGVSAALIPHRSTHEPKRVVAMIGDQKDAIESVFAFVNGYRTLSTGYIKELHSLFTRNQEYTEGRDQFDQATLVPLVRGDYKQQPNNPTRPDGTLHAYCPPEHVTAEMDKLVALHSKHSGVAPEVEAAWLHHRFTQIHPFQDGNGRLARALATLIFIKANWLPLVVRDAERAHYISALEEADNGDLHPLVTFFSKLQRREFISALGVARDLEDMVRVSTRIQAIGKRLADRRRELEQDWQAAISNAERLHDFAGQRLDEVCSMLQEVLADHEAFTFFVDQAHDQEERSYWFQHQIVSTAKQLRYYANTRRYRAWSRLVMRDGSQAQILLSFHCIGFHFQGVLACSATWFRRVPRDDGGNDTDGETALNDEVFQVNYKESLPDIESRFKKWLEAAIERGLALWEATA